MVSHNGKLAALRVAQVQRFTTKLYELASRHSLLDLDLELSATNNYPPRFPPDDGGLVYQVLRNGGHTLLYQPLDGSPPRALLNPVSDSLPDFGWSPSGKQLAVIHRKSSSDVVLITDLERRGENRSFLP